MEFVHSKQHDYNANRNAIRTGCILLNKDNKLLAVHNAASGFWGFPKGGKEPNETVLGAALRELFEETGVRLDPSLICNKFSSRKDSLFFAKGDFSPVCTIDGYEIDAYEWITLEELSQRPTSKFTQRFFIRIGDNIQCDLYRNNY